MQTREVADHPLAVMQFPVERRLPMFAVDCLPTFGKPPAEVLIAAVVDELEKVSVTDWSLVDREILKEDLMRGLLVIKCKSLTFVSQLKQATFYLRHAFDFR